MNPTKKQWCSGRVSRSCKTWNRVGHQYAKINTNDTHERNQASILRGNRSGHHNTEINGRI